jgi:ABC-type branched-subunit amino acid transport system ATPase component
LGDRWEIERFSDLFLGGVLLAVMLLRPGGLLGDRDLLRALRQRWRPPTRSATIPAGTDVLRADDIVVDFGGFRALDGPVVQVRPGEVVGLIGPNGAGKTTLFNVITGLVAESSGRVTLGDVDLTESKPHEIARAGLARTFQNLRIFTSMTVRENVELTSLVAWRHRQGGPSVDALLADAGLTAVADRLASTLDYGNQRRLELARAAALAPAFLLLDEPTSGMSELESLAMAERVRATARAIGAGVLVIDHDLGFIAHISDHVVVLAQGAVLSEGTPDQVRADPAVAVAYLGRGASAQ